MIPEPLHPAVVHFPIVLALLAPLFAFGALWAIRRGASSRKAWGLTTALLAALALSSWVSVETGEQQEEVVEDVVAQQPFETHEEAAEAFLLLAGGVLAVAVVGLVGGRVGRAARVVGAAATLALVAGSVRVGHSGGQLAYRYGAASAYAADVAAPGADDSRGQPGVRPAGEERGRRRGGDGDGR
jgi:uncharacterized membrane protein